MDLKSKAMLSVAETVRNMYNPKPIQPVEEASMMKDDGKVVHNCAKHVEHTTWGRGVTMSEQHAAPDEAGNIGWYDVLFDHGLEKAVPTANLNILVSESHGHPVKKKAMKESDEHGHTVDVNKYDSHTHGEEGEYYNGLADHAKDKEHLHHLMNKHGYKEGKHYETSEWSGMHDDMLRDVHLKAPHHKEILKHHDIKHFLHHLEHDDADTVYDYKKGKVTAPEKPGLGTKLFGKKNGQVKEALHPNQQVLDVHEPEKDKLTADDFKKLRAGKKTKVKEDTEVKETLSGDNSRNTENDRTKETAMQAVKDASAKTANTQATPGQVNGAKVGGEKELIHQGVREEVEVDETIIYKTIGYDIQEADGNYDAHFKAHMKKAGIKHPGELKTDAEKKAFFNKVDAGFKAKNEDVFLEALLSADVADRIKGHESAGHKVSDKANRMKDGEMEYSFVVTQPSGKRSRHIYHGSKVKHETMSPAPKSKEASEIGDDEDDK
jgi:hypothetical protein